MSVLVLENAQKVSMQQGVSLDDFSLEKAQEVRAYHQSFSEYAPTQLVSLPKLAEALGLGNIMLKDESSRFGLKAFKVLGASHAMGRYLAQKLGEPFAQVTCDFLCDAAVRARMGEIVFASTTDGNHGRGVAWTAQKLQQQAEISMPQGSSAGRVKNITDLGALCTVSDKNYDETVRMTFEKAQKEGHILVQDTAWEGYEQIPLWIKQGYLTLALETLEQLQAQKTMPTHLFLQAGVGSFPAAMVAFFHAVLGDKAPKCIIMEPHSAPCFYISARMNDGNAHTVDGDLSSLMAGLACGKPCIQSWPIIRDYAFAFVSSPDFIAANGMRILAAPLPGDVAVTSGESGACTMGLVHWLMQCEGALKFRELLGLNEKASVLCISTEGDTVPEIYRSVVWQGAFAEEKRKERRHT